ncbi:hypothetical protein AB837_00396 [bacterium AB1]|nr:hypothetical protein AB837_00396 [bacterium AB1]
MVLQYLATKKQNVNNFQLSEKKDRKNLKMTKDLVLKNTSLLSKIYSLQRKTHIGLRSLEEKEKALERNLQKIRESKSRKYKEFNEQKLKLINQNQLSTKQKN